MGESSKVRFSRDGDQFHYLWAARRCLRLLSPTSGLISVSIEGPSAREIIGDSLDAGEEVIDVAEYFGSEEIEKACRIRYIQLKHSTQRPSEAWTPSGLEKTIRGFAARYQELEDRFGADFVHERIAFTFLSNRPINSEILETIRDLGSNVGCRHSVVIKKLETFTSFTGDTLSSFCKLLNFEGGHAGYQVQRAELALETRMYLPGNDVDAPIQLKELVTRKALSESEHDPSITKTDVLRALGITEDQLYPAPYRIEAPDHTIPRAQEVEIVTKIIEAEVPVIVHAAGGVGKSVLAQGIKPYLPANSVLIVYDCFGNGEYRRAGSPRHRHKDALVQIANELAALGLCDPLLPSCNADITDYLRAFSHRIRQCLSTIKGYDNDALLCIAIDAADNAEMAAEEFGDDRSFARDLLREAMPEGLRLVVLCRTERQHLLKPPPSVLTIELSPFTKQETAAHLYSFFSDASENDVEEFHRLTSHNPRVQATALAQSNPLPDILRSLGPNPTTVDSTIASLLEHAIAQILDRVGNAERTQIESICSALAVLRPLVPVTVLAAVSGVHVSAVKSFAHDLGRPLLVTGDAVQFRDEPVETWFRQRFRPVAKDLSSFIDTLQPLSNKSAYVASTLPQLMLEAGRLGDLVELALSSASLPTNPIDRRDVEIHRLQFALKASLRAGRYLDAAKLALKAGEETAGNTRQQQLFQSNTDLVAALIEPDRILEIVSRRTFGGGWVGAHHAYEAGLLSHVKDFRGDARSRLRMAYEWLRSWSKRSKNDHETEEVQERDIAEMALAQLNLNGAERCAAELRGWTPREISYRAGLILSRRLIDHSRFDDLNALAASANDDIFLLLAITNELRQVNRVPPRHVIEQALPQVLPEIVKVSFSTFYGEGISLRAITSFVEAAYIHGLSNKNILADILNSYLPDAPPRTIASHFSGERFSLLRAYALKAALTGVDLELVYLAHPELREQLEDKKTIQRSQEVDEFKSSVGSLLPWHVLWAKNLVDSFSENVGAQIVVVREKCNNASRFSHRDELNVTDEIAEMWLDILMVQEVYDDTSFAEYIQWVDSQKRPLYIQTLTKFARLCARTSGFEPKAYDFAHRAYKRSKDAKDDATSTAESNIELARAILATDRAEAVQYFERAVEVASKIGDEINDRWQAILDLAVRAGDFNRPVPETAYRLARCAELAETYDSDHFEWKETVKAIAGLSPSSCLAIISRWRDRNFGWHKMLLPCAIQYLLAHGQIDSKIVPALIGFRVEWDYCEIAAKVLERLSSTQHRQVVLDHLLKHIRLAEHSPATWETLKEVGALYELDVSEVEKVINFNNETTKNNSDSEKQYRPDSLETNWDDIFCGCDIRSSSGLSVAYSRFKSGKSPYYHEVFFSELFNRIEVGKESELVNAFSECVEFEPYHYSRFFEQVPDAYKHRMAVKASLAHAVKTACTRHCMEMSKNRYYQPLSFKLAAAVSGIPEKELVGIVLNSIGEYNEIIGSSRLFSIVGLLVTKLTHEEALDALHFGLGLFDSVLDDDDGDGPWTSGLMPPSEVSAALARYIWVALAAPDSSLRWEAAHVVRGLCILGGEMAVTELINLAEENTGGSFADVRLHFYHLHARQWLVIALARVAKENPTFLIPFADFFIRQALKGEPHIMIRHFAAQAALELASRGHLNIKAEILDSLKNVNKPALPKILSKVYNRQTNHVHPMHRASRSSRFSFDYDMSRYWFEDLGDLFAMSSTDIEIEIEKVICDDWHLGLKGHWDDDVRARQGYFRDGASTHSHGSYPRIDDLRFYLPYHSMMIVAGKLLSTTALHQDPEESDDEFQYWFRRHLLSRTDGGWLADRRDPVPLEWPAWKNEKEEDHWRWSVTKPDFERGLGVHEKVLNLWGRWSSILGYRKETIHISSALVSSDRSASLLRALQTASNPHDYKIPDAGDRLEIDELGFSLKGWILDPDSDARLDKFDPWAGDIPNPPPRPAKFVRDMFNLVSDAEGRSWVSCADGESQEVLWTEVWGGMSTKDDDAEAESGYRLRTSWAFLKIFLENMKMDLIVEVEISRKKPYSRYESYKDDGLGYIPPYCKLFVLKSTGDFHAI